MHPIFECGYLNAIAKKTVTSPPNFVERDDLVDNFWIAKSSFDALSNSIRIAPLVFAKISNVNWHSKTTVR